MFALPHDVPSVIDAISRSQFPPRSRREQRVDIDHRMVLARPKRRPSGWVDCSDAGLAACGDPDYIVVDVYSKSKTATLRVRRRWQIEHLRAIKQEGVSKGERSRRNVPISHNVAGGTNAVSETAHAAGWKRGPAQVILGDHRRVKWIDAKRVRLGCDGCELTV